MCICIDIYNIYILQYKWQWYVYNMYIYIYIHMWHVCEMYNIDINVYIYIYIYTYVWYQKTLEYNNSTNVPNNVVLGGKIEASLVYVS